MKKQILIIFLLVATSLLAENYRKVKLSISSKSEIVQLQKFGIALDDAYQNKDGSIDVFLNEKEFSYLSRTSLKYDVVIDNWEQYYNEKRTKSSSNLTLSKVGVKYPVNGFTFGSMGGNYTLSEVWEKIDEMIATYPHLISEKDSIGASLENRPIYAVRISDNPNTNEDEPEVLYTALIHAREPESMMQMMYFLYYLLENYGTDEEVTYLIDNREMYFIPVINPDGYAYNESTNPNGGGMWRKNRRYNIDGTYGVDLNRNYGFEWGYDNYGSTGTPSGETYRGQSAFSEPETETVRQYCINHDFRLALNYHTYSNLLITPWGYIPEATPDSVFYSEIASDMTQFNNYQWGYSESVIYAVNGDSDDWFYGEQTEKNKIFAMTPEVGSGSDGFWPNQDRIIPLAVENVYPNLYLAWVAGGFVNTLNFNFDKQFYSANDSGNIDITLKNKGLEDIDNINVIINISDNAELLNEANFNAGKILARSGLLLEDLVKFKVKDSTPAGDSVFVQVKYYSSDLLLTTDSYSFIVGTPTIYFVDSLNTLDNWALYTNGIKNWDISTDNFYSFPSSATDSKVGNYLSNTKTSITSKFVIDLESIANPFLKFRTKYNIESGWDYGQVSTSSDSVSWEPIGGDRAKYGSGNFQPSNELIYDGLQSEWISEIINLNNYNGKKIYLKFELCSDESEEKDGWYIDNVEIMGFANKIVSIKDETEIPTKILLSQNFPNPFNPSTIISYSITNNGKSETSNVKLIVFDVLGNEVATLVNEQKSAGNYNVDFDASNLSSGIYFYQLQSGNFTESKKMILLK